MTKEGWNRCAHGVEATIINLPFRFSYSSKKKQFLLFIVCSLLWDFLTIFCSFESCCGMANLFSKYLLVALPFLCSYECVFTMIKIVKSLLVKLDSRFFFHEVLDAFGIIYFQYWIQEEIEVSFLIHLGGFKVALCRFYRTKWSRKLNYWNPFRFNISLVARFVQTHNESPNKGCHWYKLIHSIVVYNFKFFRMFVIIFLSMSNWLKLEMSLFWVVWRMRGVSQVWNSSNLTSKIGWILICPRLLECFNDNFSL